MTNEKKVRRCENIAGKWMPDGSIRFYQMNERKGGVPELVNGYAGGVMPCIIAGHEHYVIVDYDIYIRKHMIAKIYPDGHPDLQGKKDPTHPVRYFDIRKLTPAECYRLMGVPEVRIKQLMATEQKPYTALVGVDKELEVLGLEPSATMKEVDDAYREAIESVDRPATDDDAADDATDDAELTRIMDEKAEDDSEERELMRQNYTLCYDRIRAAKTEQRYGPVQIISNSNHYKLAGNSIVCDVLMYIYEAFLFPTDRRVSGEIQDMFALPPFQLKRNWLVEPLRLVTLCSGYDSQAIAMDMLKERYPDFRYELMAWAEYDPESRRPLSEQPAVVAHNLLFPQWQQRNLGDMTKIDWKKFMEYECEETSGDRGASDESRSGMAGQEVGVEHQSGIESDGLQVSALRSHRVRPLKPGDIDFLTYSTPCQSISQAGKREGIKKGSDTRSAVLWYTEQAVAHLRPKVLLQENVSALINSVNMPDFREWCALLEKHGYQNFLAPQFPYPWGKDRRDKKTKPGILNSKHYGVAQNRERVYMLSVRRDILGPSERVAGEYSPATQYEFPRPFALDTCIADVLEDNVDERFFLKPDSVIKFLTVNEATDASDIHYMVTDHKLTDEEIREARKG